MKSAAGNIKIYGIPGAERTYVGGIRYNYNGIIIAYAYMQVNVGAHHLWNVNRCGNAAVGNVRFFESSNNIVHMESCKRVVIQGIHDCILSEKNGQILICQRSEEQRIKEFSAE